MVSSGIMTKQINVRMPEKLLKSANKHANEKGFASLQDFIRETIREKLFDEPDLSMEELVLINKLFKASEAKKLYGTEKQLFKKL